GLTYSYFTDALGTTVLSSPNAVTASGTYYIKGTSAAVCSDIQPITVTINPVPTVVINNPAAVCSGTTVDLTASAVTAGSTAGLTYSYFADALGTIVLSSPNAVAVSGTYYIKGTAVGGCSDIQPVTVTINPLLALAGTQSTLCATDGSGYVLTLTVTGKAPYMATGTGAPGTWTGNTWTSGSITTGTNYNVTLQDASMCNQILVTDVAPVCCVFEVVCPTFSTTTVSCYNQIPTAAILTVNEFEALGNGDGVIGNAPCGVIEITASNGEAPVCNGTVIRTYTITEYADTNHNKIRDNGENTILNSSVCTQNFTINRSDFVMPVNGGSTVACAAAVTAPTVPVVTDNCGNVLVPSSPVISTIPTCNGVETYTYTFTDCKGNTHDWVYTYTIDNTVAPTGTVPANLTLQCMADVPVANINAVTNTKSNCNGTIAVTVADTNNGGTGCKGNPYIVTRTYTLTDCGGLSTNLVQTITVADTMAPVFVEVLPANTTVDCSAAIPAAVTLTAIDNCAAATVTYNEVRINGSCSGNYQLQRTWTAADTCGNTITHTQVVTVKDTTAPVFVAPLPAAVVDANCATIPPVATLTATDTCGTATVDYSETREDGDCSSRYTLIRTWIASDTCGNETTYTQTINVGCVAEIYNSLSPNGDGINDTFQIGGIDCFPNNSVKIFNRYGTIVYEKEGYDNVTDVFEGISSGRATFKKGDKLPTGTYFYTLEYDNKGTRVTKSGYLYISN
ncbi:gliding motility-associated C-terminal domain-containing protein, partial [Flavobacterium sp. FlaQc-48]|uniref:gliding motility-associated C-terminal domain-containing protein n=1 Tax=Flavobacterium sp. FlaQc-48 TaxID=3374181 RepID=UPI003756C0E8